MKNKNSIIRYLTAFYLLVELIIYGVFMLGDITGTLNINTITLLKYVSILFCIVYSIMVFYLNRQTDYVILIVALFLTGVSDYFLLFTDSFTYGMLFFSLVQLLYLIRLWYQDMCGGKKSVLWYRLLFNAIAWTGVLFILSRLKIIAASSNDVSDDILLSVASFYFITIFHNVIRAFLNMKKYKNSQSRLFAIGMILFILCDINVGIFNMKGFVDINQGYFLKLYDFSKIGMWMFYLPAQVCISLSGCFLSRK